MIVRHARPGDRAAIAQVNLAAFGRPGEGDLVERLRADGEAVVELVAEQDGEVVGHILFSRLWADSPELFVALAPMSVRPGRQRAGVGSALVARGLQTLKDLGAGGVIVVGHPAYYPRFGFTPQAAAAIRAPYSGSPAFMALALSQGALDAPLTIAYPQAFGSA